MYRIENFELLAPMATDLLIVFNFCQTARTDDQTMAIIARQI